MYTVLTGAKINMGDFLITERCQALLRAHLPHQELFTLPHWEPLDAHLEKINAGDAVIIMGGPGLQPGFYPRVYRLVDDLEKLKVPVVPMGVGWKGYPGDQKSLDRYSFTPASLKALRRFSAMTPWLGCRDHMSVTALKNNGIDNGLMTGCPVWYRLDAMGDAPRLPAEIRAITVTPAQRHIYKDQSIALLGLIAELYPAATRYCSFNRGIDQNDPLIPEGDRGVNRQIADAARKLGYDVRDTSYGTGGLGFYEESDIHVGYRVHSHLYFLSARKPSILLHEDGRGRGMSEALDTPGVDAFTLGLFRRIKPAPDAIFEVKTLLEEEGRTGFARFSGLSDTIERHYETMKKFIFTLPGAQG